MNQKTILFAAFMISILVAFIAKDIRAGTGKRTGTAGATELLIPVGSVGASLSGNYTAGIGGAEAMFWNPAGIANTSNAAEVLVSHTKTIGDIGLNYAAVLADFKKFGYLGISIKSLDFGDIPVTTEYATDGTGETYSPSYVIFGSTYGRRMTDRILFGFSAKIISEQIMNVSATGAAFDFGVQVDLQNGARIGVSLRNFGTGMRFDGNDLERRVDLPNSISEPIGQKEDLRIVSQKFEYPTTIDIGAAYTRRFAGGHTVTVMTDFLNHHFGFDGYGGGAEYTFHMEKFKFSLRTGATARVNPDNDKILFHNDENIFGVSFGGGIRVELARQLNLGLDYSYRMTALLADNQWFSATIGF